MTKLYLNSFIILTLSLSVFACSGGSGSSSSLNGVISESIAGSEYHAPNSTWWGYNMSKVVRYGTRIYIGVVENFDNTGSLIGNFKIYQKEDGAGFVFLDSFPTSRPGNILVDSTGEIHVITFEPYDILQNDSIGSLVINSSSGINVGAPVFTREVIVAAPNANQEYVNIRIGAAISSNDHIAIVHGLNQYNPVNSLNTVQLYLNEGSGWVTKTFTNFTSGQETEYYYPFVTFDNNDNVFILPVQDEYYLPGGSPPAVNLYYKIPYLKYDRQANNFTFTMLEDVSLTPLASTNYHMLEQSEVYFDTSTLNTYFIYKKAVSSSNKDMILAVRNSSGVVTKQNLSWANSKGANWLRLFSYNNKIYSIFVSWDKIYAADVATGKVKQLKLQVPVGSYLYLSSERGGVDINNPMLDIYLISGASSTYPGSTYKIHSVPKSEIGLLF
jgi:hypothetical protein